MPRTLGLPIPARPLTSLLRALASLVGRSAARYRPERHYMRGPGPKCREKSSPTERP
jgi:hypothetical protein